ncbi:MAG: DNA-directed DNA polymerase II small subunit [Thermoplasmatota archaeon]
MDSIIKLFSAHGTFVQPDTLAYILKKENPEDFSIEISKKLTEFPLILTIDHLKTIEEQEKKKPITEPTAETLEEKKQQNKVLKKLYNQQAPIITEELDNQPAAVTTTVSSSTMEPKTLLKQPLRNCQQSWHPASKDYDAEIKILKDITGQSTCEGTTSDFMKLFADRYDILRKLLRTQRRELAHVIPINRMQKSGIKDIQIVGIVNEVRTTANGHKLLELEDDTGMVTCIVLKKFKEVFETAQNIVPDEIIGVTGQQSKHGDLFLINHVVYPDISLNNKRHTADVPLYAAFLSDIHIGSKDFLEKQWYSFLKWINGNLGNSRQKDVAGKIKYIVIPGDVVDGIGIYPNQEHELSITDLYKQYESLAEQLSCIPDHISLIIQPGNHDAVRPAEPQPTFEKEICQLFNANEVTFLGNPSYFSLHNVELLSYHGQSLLDFATNIQHLKYNEPIEIMKVMLQKHHLAPVYGGYTPLAPEHRDYMVIDRVPDIFVTGHVHLASLGEYRGVTLINASSWQAQTSYQKMLNFIPDPAKLPIADLQTGNVTMMDFNKQP